MRFARFRRGGVSSSVWPGWRPSSTRTWPSTTATPYPGTNAVWPVAGAGLLILAGQMVDSSNPTVVMRMLAIRPMRWVGRLSYSWYLWHWPLIILAVLAIGNDSVPVRTSAALVSLGLAYIAYRLVENPLRFSQSLIRSSRRTFLVGLAITGVTIGTAGAVWEIAARSTPASYAELQSAALKVFFPVCAPAKTPQGISYCAGGDLSSRPLWRWLVTRMRPPGSMS